jgi:hypothetical protein
MEQPSFQAVGREGLSEEETKMKSMIVAVSVIALIGTAPTVFAQGVSSKTPGHEMQTKG